MASEAKTEPAPERFEEILTRLRGLVERLELCRRGTAILDGAEKKVELLLGGAGAPRTTSFDQP